MLAQHLLFWCLLMTTCTLGTYLAFKLVYDLYLCNKMYQREKELEQQGIKPYGSTLSHGMCYDRENKTLVADQKKSLAWYRRLTY